jgi:hypothetical protein
LIAQGVRCERELAISSSSFFALISVAVLPHVKRGSGKPVPRSVFIQAHDSSGRPIKTTVGFHIPATRDPSQPVVTAINSGVQLNSLDRGVPLEFTIMSPGYGSVGAALGSDSPARINLQLHPANLTHPNSSLPAHVPR